MSTTVIILSKIIAYLSNLSAVPAILAGYKRKGLLWLYVVSSFFFDIVSFVLKYLEIGFSWSSNFFFLTEFVLLSLYFTNQVFNKKTRFKSRLFITLAAIYFIIHTLFTTKLYSVNYGDTAYFYGIFILFSIIGMYKLLNEATIIPIERSPLFIFCVAILIYASGSFIIILYENELLKTDEKFIKYAWIFIRNPLNIFKNLLLYYVFVLMKNKWHHHRLQ